MKKPFFGKENITLIEALSDIYCFDTYFKNGSQIFYEISDKDDYELRIIFGKKWSRDKDKYIYLTRATGFPWSKCSERSFMASLISYPFSTSYIRGEISDRMLKIRKIYDSRISHFWHKPKVLKEDSTMAEHLDKI